MTAQPGRGDRLRGPGRAAAHTRSGGSTDESGPGTLTVRTVIATRAPGSRNRGFRCPPRAAGGTVLAALLLCLPALAGCGSSEEEPRIQRVAFCQGAASDNPQGDPVSIEFRQGSEVVARATGSAGVALTVEVPWGPTQIYVDGVQKGSVDEGVSADAYHSPGPEDVTYIASAEGCPEEAPPAAG